MQKTKTIIYISLILVVIVFVGMLSSCGQSNSSSNSARSDDDLRFYYSTSLIFEIEDGFYYQNENDFVKFFDYKSQQSVIVCNKPNCKHEEWNEFTPDEQRCNAFQMDNIQAGFVDNDKLYILINDYFESKTSIIRADLDCANQEVIAEVESSHISYIVINEGVLYFANNSHVWDTDEEGMPLTTGKAFAWLCSIDLKSGKTTDLTEKMLNYNSSLRILNAYDDVIYLAYAYFEEHFDGTNFNEAKKHEEIYEYNIVTGEYKESKLEFETDAMVYKYIYDDMIVVSKEEFYAETMDVLLADINTGDIINVVNDADTMKIFGSDIKYSKFGKQYLYDIETGEVKELNEKLTSEFYVVEEFDEYIFGQLGSDIYHFGEKVLIAKEDYLNGEPNYIYIETE